MLWLFAGPTGVYLLDFFCSGVTVYLAPLDSLPPGGQANRGWLAPQGASCPGGKINWDTGIQFYLLLSPYLCFISLLYFDLYVLGDDALIS